MSEFGEFGLDPVMREAYERFERCKNWESDARKLFLDDLKFANGDPDNGYQWPNDIRRNRSLDERPCLTINKVRQHCLQIINDAKQNKPGVTIRGTGNGATKESADMLEGIVRHIEYQSNATVAYDTATTFQVFGGIGYWRVVTDYVDEESFDQEIYIRRIDDPLCVFIDPDIKEFDGSDARYAFIFEDLPKQELEKKYPEFHGMIPEITLPTESWIGKDTIRIAEYYRKVEVEDQLVTFLDQQGQRQTILQSKLPEEIVKDLEGKPGFSKRSVVRHKVEWKKIVGDKVVEERDWPGSYIPVIRLVGEEVVIEGRLDRKGHTRVMKDAQRMYNYWTSSAVEHVALQGKTPWVGPVEAFEEFEEYWKTANKENHAYLPYNGFLDDGVTQIPPPQRAQPPVMAAAYINGMDIANKELMYVSGQYQSMLGEPSNERTGRAIGERQRQGDNATYHFVDNLGVAIRYTGKIILDLIPKIYDTRRILNIIAEDGTDLEVEIDPGAKQAYLQQVNHNQEVVKRIFNPNLGRYQVEADIGPGYGTKRQEAFNAFTLLLTQAPALTSVIGDIMLRAGDFPMADEAAERLRRMVPKAALGEGPSQAEQQLMAQVQSMEGQLKAAIDSLAQEKMKLLGKDQMRDIDVYKAETDRLKAFVKDLPLNPGGLKAMIEQLVQETLQTSLQGVVAASAPDLQAEATAGGPSGQNQNQMSLPLEEPPLPGARKAADGNWYLNDPDRPGKYLQVGRG